MEEDDGEGEALRKLITEAIKTCTDFVLLDLICKLLTTSN